MTEQLYTLEVTAEELEELKNVCEVIIDDIQCGGEEPCDELYNVTDKIIELYEEVIGEEDKVYYTLSPSVKAFSKVYPEEWINHVVDNDEKWIEFKKAYDALVEHGYIIEE